MAQFFISQRELCAIGSINEALDVDLDLLRLDW